MAVKLKINDEVVVIAGKYKGTKGRVLKINRRKDLITIDKVNMVKKHSKPTQQNPDGGIQEFEAPIHISNVALSTKDGVTKVGFKIDDKGKKHRIARKTGKEV